MEWKWCLEFTRRWLVIGKWCANVWGGWKWRTFKGCLEKKDTNYGVEVGGVSRQVDSHRSQWPLHGGRLHAERWSWRGQAPASSKHFRDDLVGCTVQDSLARPWWMNHPSIPAEKVRFRGSNKWSQRWTYPNIMKWKATMSPNATLLA